MAKPPVNPSWIDPAPSARFWRWRLTGGRVPVEHTVDAAHAICAALNDTAAKLFESNRLPPDLHSRPGPTGSDGRQVHTHAFFLPEDLDLDGYLDHVAVASPAPMGGTGFSRLGLVLLAACPGFWVSSVADVALEPAWLGPDCAFGSGDPAREWLSLTPFVPPLHRLPPEDQIVRTLSELGLPRPAHLEQIADATQAAGRIIPARDFAPRGVAARRWTKFAGREGQMAYWRIVFPEPVEGPILIGGLCHFGLGRFAASDD